MSSPSPWIKEPETGRWYMHGKDQWGQTVRRYSDEVPVTASASNPSAIPVTEVHPSQQSVNYSSTPRYTADASTTRHSGKRRDSHSSEPRHQRPTQTYRGQQQQQPVSAYRRSKSKYHDPGGFDPPRKVESPYEAGHYVQDTRSPQASGTLLVSPGYDDGGRPPQPLSTDPLASDVGRLRIDEMTDDAQYTAAPLSGPATQGSLNRALSTRQDSTSATYQDQIDRTQWPILPNSGRGVSEGAYQPRASADAIDIAVSQPSATGDPRHIVGTPGDQEPLDSKYVVRNFDYQRFFSEGRVFSTLWTDPVSSKTIRNPTFVSYVAYGERVHTKIRRFVVVRQRGNCCNCLPVTSYEGRGAKKNGINLDEHSQIYSEKCPKKVSGMSKKALKVKVSRGAPKIKESSLVNYGRIYTVECNVKVMDIGTLDDYSRRLLLEYYNADNFRSGSYPQDRPLDQNPQGDSGDFAGIGSSFQTNTQNSASFNTPGLVSSIPNSTPQTQYTSNRFSDYGPQLPDSNYDDRGTSSGGGYRVQVGSGSQPGVTQPTTTANCGYSRAPVYDMNRKSTTVPSTIDPRYVPSSDPAEGSGAPTTPYYSPHISDAGNATNQRLPISSSATGYHISNSRDNHPRFNTTLPSSSEDYRDTSNQGFQSAGNQGVRTTTWAQQQPSSSNSHYPPEPTLPDSQVSWSSVPQTTSPSTTELDYNERQSGEGEVIVLPTREEVEAEAPRVSRTRRQSSSRPHGGQDRPRYGGRERDRERERPRERERVRVRERSRHDERSGRR